MAGSFSDFAEAKLLNHILGGENWNPPSQYLGYSLSSGGESAAGTEPSGAGYARVGVGSSFWQTSTVQETHNILDIKLPKSTAVQGKIVSIQIYDSSVGGNMISYIPIDGDLVVEEKDAIIIPTGVIIHTWAAGGFTNYLKNLIFNHVYKSVAMPVFPQLSFNYMTSAPSDTLAGNEPSGGERITLNNNQITFSIATGGITTLSPELVFEESTANQGTAGWLGIWNNATAGNFLAYGPLDPVKEINTGDVLVIESGSVVFTLD